MALSWRTLYLSWRVPPSCWPERLGCRLAHCLNRRFTPLVLGDFASTQARSSARHRKLVGSGLPTSPTWRRTALQGSLEHHTRAQGRGSKRLMIPRTVLASRDHDCRADVPGIGRCQPRKIAMILSQKQSSAPTIMPAKDGKCSKCPATTASPAASAATA